MSNSKIVECRSVKEAIAGSFGGSGCCFCSHHRVMLAVAQDHSCVPRFRAFKIEAESICLVRQDFTYLKRVRQDQSYLMTCGLHERVEV